MVRSGSYMGGNVLSVPSAVTIYRRGVTDDATVVLVHGAWHGAWCWYKVVPALTRAGHTVLAPDLPSLGRDRTPIADVSLDRWTDSVCQLIETAGEPVMRQMHERSVCGRRVDAHPRSGPAP